MLNPLNNLKTMVPLFMVLTLFFTRKQMISILLTLELFVCLMYFGLTTNLVLGQNAFSLALFFMCVMVCEAMTGIGILISSIREKGNNLIEF